MPKMSEEEHAVRSLLIGLFSLFLASGYEDYMVVNKATIIVDELYDRGHVERIVTAYKKGEGKKP